MNLTKSIILSLLFFAFHSYKLVAQEFHVSKSEVFEEPVNGSIKILQLKNGYTFLLHIDEKADGIDLTIFDKNRKIVKAEKLMCKATEVDKLKPDFVRGFYEINGEPVLFIDAEYKEKTAFYRVRLEPISGAVIKEDELGAIEDDNRLYRHAFILGNDAGMNVAKDAASDCYAVIITNWNRNEGKQSIRVMHFDGAHNKINECSYNPNKQKFKFVKFCSAVVDGGKRVLLFCGGCDGKMGHGSADFDYLMTMKMNVNDKELTIKPLKLNVERKLKDVKTQALYDKVNNRMQVLTVWLDHTVFENKTNTFIHYYLSMIYTFDAETLNVSYITQVAAAKANGYARLYIDSDYEYPGIARKIVHNRDNTLSVLLEIQLDGFFGDLAISQLSDTTELEGYIMRKKQTPTSMANNRQFMSYNYVSTPKCNYVILNDVASNFNKNKNEKIKPVTTVSGTNAVVYKLGNNEVDRVFLFGEPGKDEYRFGYVDGADYNEGLDTYATVIVEREGREKQARMAWVTFE